MQAMRRLTLLWVLAALTASCSGSDKASGPSVDTGLPPNKSLAQLTDAEAHQACQAFADAYNAEFGGAKLTQFSCAVLAVASTTSSTACQSKQSDCVAHPPSDLPFSTGFSMSCDSATAANLSSCTATVSDYERCADDSISAAKKYEAEFNCSIAGDTQQLNNLATMGVGQPDSCVSLNTKCGL